MKFFFSGLVGLMVAAAISGVTLHTPTGIDTAQSVERVIPKLKAQGITAVGRYYMRNSRYDKVLSVREAKAMAAAGMKVFVVYEGPGDKLSYFTYDNGTKDAIYSLQHGRDVGQPSESTVYFAVDFDPSRAEIESNVLPYFQGVNDVLKKSGLPGHVGVYGSGLVIRMLEGKGLATRFWIACAYGWLESRSRIASGRWHILQHLPTTRYGGIDTDPNEFNPDPKFSDAGLFVPFSPQEPSKPPRPVQPVTQPSESDQPNIVSDPSEPPRELWWWEDIWHYLFG